jgi:tRNA(Arg) A34 adenosine deaminase TadA
MKHDGFMAEAVRLSLESVRKGTGPFGAVVVKDGRIVGRGHNRVTSTLDPTAHAEITAIRDAASNLGAFDLSGAVLYTSSYPCPMCLGAAYWARLDRVYYANSIQDAARAGFDDQFFYDELARPEDQRSLPMIHLEHPEASIAFDTWIKLENKTVY